MKIRVKNELPATRFIWLRAKREKEGTYHFLLYKPTAVHFLHLSYYTHSIFQYSFSLFPLSFLFFLLAPKIIKTNDCYMNEGYYLRPLKKSGTNKQPYYFRFPFSSCNSCHLHYYYHFNNPLRVVCFHINLWALAD